MPPACGLTKPSPRMGGAKQRPPVLAEAGWGSVQPSTAAGGMSGRLAVFTRYCNTSNKPCQFHRLICTLGPAFTSSRAKLGGRSGGTDTLCIAKEWTGPSLKEKKKQPRQQKPLQVSSKRFLE